MERKQIALYLADSSHLLIIIISRSSSYLLAIGPWSFPWDPVVHRAGAQPLRRELVNVMEEAADLLQMLTIGGRLGFVN